MFGIKIINVRVVGGDFTAGKWPCVVDSNQGSISLRGKEFKTASVEVVTEANKGKFLRTTGWGLVGYAALGPLGAIAGMLGTRAKSEVCFAFTARDGTRILGVTDSSSYQHLAATAFSRR